MNRKSGGNLRVVCVTSTFPTPERYWRGTFIENFCLELSKLGAEVVAVVPQGWHVGWGARLGSLLRRSAAEERPIPTVVTRYPSFSVYARRNGALSRMNQALCQRGLERSLDRLSPKPDLVYAHFIVSGLLVADWCRRNGVPLAVVSGESDYRSFLQWMDKRELVKRIAGFDHLFFVSERNRQALTGFLGEEREFGGTLPNGVDSERFRPIEQQACRQRLGLPENGLIAAFVGYFVERKGALRVLRAMEKVDGVYGVFVGTGDQVPRGERVLHAGPVENEEIPFWLSAADFFVLPSYHEGRSNAVLEALACGLPVIVSDRDFNREFLTEECAIFVEPDSIDGIAEAISLLAGDRTKRIRMGEFGRRHSLSFSQRKRAMRFLEVVSGENLV